MENMSASSSTIAEPTWDIAYLFPRQGQWSEDEYLALDTNRLVEFSHGILEVLSMPTQSHQLIVLYLYQLLSLFTNKMGTFLWAPLRVQLWPGKIREPDVVLMLAAHDERRGDRYWRGADLVIEVVSPDDRRRDYEVKRREYARANIPEYWIVDQQEAAILVLTLENGRYLENGRFQTGEVATSKLLDGFTVEVTAVFEAAKQ
ncbi:MAG: Uma2 family endonuclease [Chloroflexi bacterium]|nr:MAG: Uma2 family endonuclease [Chloroflexota bacterium]